MFQSTTPLNGNDYDSDVDLVNINDLGPSAPEPGTFWLLVPACRIRRVFGSPSPQFARLTVLELV